MFISFTAVFLLPLTVLGMDYAKDFWASNWYLPVVFFVLIAFFNIFFLSNWSILKYVETEDWTSLKPVIEEKIYKKGRISYTSVKLLVNACYLTADMDSLFRLEEFVEKNKPVLYRKSQLMFVSGRLLKENAEDVEKYLEPKINRSSGPSDEWLLFDYCFVLVLQKKSEKALINLKELTEKSKDRVIRLCSVYLLYIASGEVPVKLRDDFISENSRDSIDKIIKKEKEELHVLFLSRIIEQSVEWIYGERDS